MGCQVVKCKTPAVPRSTWFNPIQDSLYKVGKHDNVCTRSADRLGVRIIWAGLGWAGLTGHRHSEGPLVIVAIVSWLLNLGIYLGFPIRQVGGLQSEPSLVDVNHVSTIDFSDAVQPGIVPEDMTTSQVL